MNKTEEMTELAEFRNELYIKPQLKMLFFELTDCCNLSCRHCGSKCSPKNATYLDKRLVFKALDEIKAAYGTDGILVCITGGEPMLHPDFFEIAEHTDRLGFRWGMTTNATLIDSSAAKRIVGAHMTSVSYSIDGTSEAHNFLRRNPAAFDRCVSGISALGEYGDTFVSMVTTVVHKQNIAELDEIYKIVDGLGVDMWRLTNIDPIGNAADGELLLGVDEFNSLLRYIRELRQKQDRLKVTYGCSHYLGEHEGDVRDGYFICGSGLYICSVCCNGDIFGCLDIERIPELVQGNVARDNIADVWKTGFGVFRRNRAKLCETCATCADCEFCAGDSAHTWDYKNNKPKICYKKGVFVL